MRKKSHFLIWLSIITGIISSEVAIAQQKPQFTQYILNNYIANPALAGIENYIDVKASHREQWKGLDGAPVTNYFSVHFPLGKKDEKTNATSFNMTGTGMYVHNYREDYTASEPHHGLGFIFMDDKAGQLKQTSGSLAYAYHLGLSSRVNISMGIGIGFLKTGLNNKTLDPENENDPALTSAQNAKIAPDLNFGVWLYDFNYFVGVSVQQLLSQKTAININDDYTDRKTVPHYFVTAGYKFWLSDNISAIPSIMAKIALPSPPSLDFNAKFTFKDKFWMGGSYRSANVFSGMLGFNISSLLHVSYAYDFTRSKLNTVSNGTQEIMLGLTLDNKLKILQPTRFW
ncbi:MAG TPA: type IX secretion system membrane protein PorP/SprF [Pelobium sp.]|nr:type IX secretion system membrane protein PorP/SprF [Pelobium sp.]